MRRWLTIAFGGLLALACAWASAAGVPADAAKGLASDDYDLKIKAIRGIVSLGDAFALDVLQALEEGRLKVSGDGSRLVFETEGGGVDALTQETLPALPEGVDEVSVNNRVRRELGDAMAALKLFAKDEAVRLKAARELAAGVSSDMSDMLPLVAKALAAESSARIRSLLQLALASVELKSEQAAVRLAAVKTLGESDHPQVKTLLSALVATSGEQVAEPDPAVRQAAAESIRAIDARLRRGEWLGGLFTGLSLGSVLLLAALGLAITYGLMGVINMAHGEFIMIGAYATYVVQNLFRSVAPAAFDGYVIAAIPVSFLAAALVGAALERSVIRFLYGRPLETLLATWGISLVLIQAMRTIFGAQNVQVENPAWLSGGVAVLSNLTLPYSRLAIIVFAALVLLAMGWVVARTRLGLFVRGVTQNRAMAACMGVHTARVDTYAFALGAGVAGLAGCALSQIGNVGPDLGQRYIVDSFMVVVLGGVGQLAGTVYAALGLGIASKFLEGVSGAVQAKIMVLVLIVVFIQKRPQGLFAIKGRSAEA